LCSWLAETRRTRMSVGAAGRKARERRRGAHAEEARPRDGARLAGADAVGPARVLAGERHSGGVPVAVTGDQAGEGLARAQGLRDVGEEAAGGPEVRV